MITPFQIYLEYQHIPVVTDHGPATAVVKHYRNAGRADTLTIGWQLLKEDMKSYFRPNARRDAAVAGAGPDSRQYLSHDGGSPHLASFGPAGNTRIELAFAGKLTPTDLKYFFEAFRSFWPHRQATLWNHLDTSSNPPYQKFADAYLGADCNSFVGSYILRRAPALFRGTERSIDGYRDRRALRQTLQQIRPGDLLLWGRNGSGDNIHIAAIDKVEVGGATASLTLAQAANDNNVVGVDYRRGFTLEANAAGSINSAIPNLFHLRSGAMGGAFVDAYSVDR
ncbi:MAG: hypothetical protein ABI806_24045 [Candidatus Solibacter sp.]